MRQRQATMGLCVALAMGAVCAPCRASINTAAARETMMDQYLPVYSWVRGGASIQVAHVEKVQQSPATEGKLRITLELEVDQTLWGDAGAPYRTAEFIVPESELVRLKFPDPVWGRVDLRQGNSLLLVTQEAGKVIRDPLYVDQISDAGNPTLNSLRQILDAERRIAAPRDRLNLYVQWIGTNDVPFVLFAAEALATDDDIQEISDPDRIVEVLVRAFESHRDPFVRISIASWIWNEVFHSTSEKGQRAIVNATLDCLDDPSDDVREFCFDRLMTLDDPAILHRQGVRIPQPSAAYLKKRLDEEIEPEDRQRLEGLLGARPH